MLVTESSWGLSIAFEVEKALNYVYHFFHVVVIPCLQPSYWRYCFPPTWIIPYMYDLRDYYMQPPYIKEREYLSGAD